MSLAAMAGHCVSETPEQNGVTQENAERNGYCSCRARYLKLHCVSKLLTPHFTRFEAGTFDMLGQYGITLPLLQCF